MWLSTSQTFNTIVVGKLVDNILGRRDGQSHVKLHVPWSCAKSRCRLDLEESLVQSLPPQRQIGRAFVAELSAVIEIRIYK